MNYTTDPLVSAMANGPVATGSGIQNRQGQSILSTYNPNTSNLPAFLGGNANAASDIMMSELTRNMWTDFEQRTLPIFDALKQYTTYNGNPGVIGELLNDAKSANESAFGGLNESSLRKSSGLGIAPNTAELGAMQRSTAMQKGLSMVDSANRAYGTQQDLNRSITEGASAIQTSAQDAQKQGSLL